MPCFYLTPKQDDFNKIPELQVCLLRLTDQNSSGRQSRSSQQLLQKQQILPRPVLNDSTLPHPKPIEYNTLLHQISSAKRKTTVPIVRSPTANVASPSLITPTYGQ